MVREKIEIEVNTAKLARFSCIWHPFDKYFVHVTSPLILILIKSNPWV